jgi:uncharacterized protein (TIGR04255 family)
MTQAPIPKRLRREPLVEAVWQMVFEPPPGVPVADFLPGVLYSGLRQRRPGVTLERLPGADLPGPVQGVDAAWMHIPRHRLSWPDSPFVAQVGAKVVTLNCRPRYAGWLEFKPRVLELLDLLQGSGLLTQPGAQSLRYIDLLRLETPPSLASLQLPLRVGRHELTGVPVQLRVELPDADMTHALMVVTPAQLSLPEGLVTGTLVDIETRDLRPPENWQSLKDSLDALHDASKRVFFEQVLTPEALNSLDPEY